MQIHKTQALIIGGGATGTGIARDLALRGVACILVERRDINAGASGSNHGLLHSGARYVLNDAMTSMECREENLLEGQCRLIRYSPSTDKGKDLLSGHPGRHQG